MAIGLLRVASRALGLALLWLLWCRPALGLAPWLPLRSADARIERLRAKGKYETALSAAQVLLDSLRSEGASTRCQISNVQALLETLKKAVSLPQGERQEITWADSTEDVVLDLLAQGEYHLAVRIAEKQAAIWKRCFGGTSPDLAWTCDVLAICHNEIGELVKAERSARTALTIWTRVFGPDDPFVARALDHLGRSLRDQGKYGEGETALRKSLAILTACDRDDPNTAVSLDDLAILLIREGRLSEAEKACRQGLAIRLRTLDDSDPGIAWSMFNLGRILRSRGDLGSSEILFRSADKIRVASQGITHPYVAHDLCALGGVALGRGDYASAILAYDRALAIAHDHIAPNNPLVTYCLTGLAQVSEAQGDFSRAESLLARAIDLRTQTQPAHPDVARMLVGVASLRLHQRECRLAEMAAQEALRIAQEMPEGSSMERGHSLWVLGDAMWCQDRTVEAERAYRGALEVFRGACGDQSLAVCNIKGQLGRLLVSKGSLDKAKDLLLSAADTYESLRGLAGLDIGRAMLTGPLYPSLAKVYLLEGKNEEAWYAAERGCGRLENDLLLANRGAKNLPSRSAREDSLRLLIQELTSLQNASEDPYLREVGIAGIDQEVVKRQILSAKASYDATVGRNAQRPPLQSSDVASLREVQNSLEPDCAIIGWVEPPDGPRLNGCWGYVLRKDRPVVWERLPASARPVSPMRRDSSLARNWRDYLEDPDLARVGDDRYRMIGNTIYRDRVAPLASHLDGIRKVVVIPSFSMLGVPVEVLETEDGRMLGDRFSIAYSPSSTIYVRLHGSFKQGDGTARAPILLVGDPPFNANQREEMLSDPYKCARDGDVFSSPLPTFAERNLAAMRGNEDSLRSLGRLCWSRIEIERIASMGRCKPRLLLGPAASEQVLYRLATNDSLSTFRIIHLATHAFSDDSRPEESCLVLSQVGLPDPLESVLGDRRTFDGRLTAREIVNEWHLNADLVVLSGCETGLGRYVSGEGYMGLAQAFLQVGARCTLVSLWRVNDLSTAILMERFYSNLLGSDRAPGGQRATPAKALAEAKKWLREYRTESGIQPYEHPYYWAAFILVGSPE